MTFTAKIEVRGAQVITSPDVMKSMPPHKPSTDDQKPREESLMDTVVDIPAMGSSNQSESVEGSEIVLQHLVRVRDDAGHESVHATLRGEVDANKQFVTLYVGFCPPFRTLPKVEAGVIEGPAGISKVTQVQHHGAQIDVELDAAPTEPAVVMVEAVAYEVEQ